MEELKKQIQELIEDTENSKRHHAKWVKDNADIYITALRDVLEMIEQLTN